jgi:nucleoside-diphosphate-sugar epimerase
MKKVILTGASGFIGRHTIPFLLQCDYQVHAVFNDKKPISSNNDNLIWHQCDLLSAGEQKKLFDTVKATHLLHFAWNVNHKTYLSSPDNRHWVSASMNMVKNFNENRGSRAVFAGTCFEYDSNSEQYSEETTALRSSSLYGASKIRLHEMINDYTSREDISYAWGRIFFLYGPHEQSTRLVPSIILSLLGNQSARCLHGDLIRDFLCVEDVASAFVSLLESNVSGPINIASGNPVRLEYIVNTISDVLNKRHLVTVEENSLPLIQPRSLVADVKRLNRELGWTPNYDLRQGLNLTVDWWKNHVPN